MFSRVRHWSHHLLARLPAALPSSCALCAGAARDGMCDGCQQQFFWHAANALPAVRDCVVIAVAVSGKRHRRNQRDRLR
ncbi:hypothetical protein ACFS07_03790 [Undibacterium arcticum]